MVRGKPEKFADHYTQATLFYDSQTEWEKAHIVGGFRFELSKLTVPAIRKRMLSSLANVSPDLASRVADGLGLEVPEPMPRALPTPPAPEVSASPALSLTARPGDGNIKARKVAILAADGVEGTALNAVYDALVTQGAVPRFVGVRLGTVTDGSGNPIEIEATFENMPAVVFDALVLPDGDLAGLQADARVHEFVQLQYRHCKTILAIGASTMLLAACGIPVGEEAGTVPADPGLLTGKADAATIGAFIEAMGAHRHPARDVDPPQV
jgi:catalase